jgi:type II secretory pathway pseudopilin PulG
MKSAPRVFPTERRSALPAGVEPELAHGRNAATGSRSSCSTSIQNFTRRDAFTLAEVLAALLMMAIIIPVAMEGMSVASRVGVLGQRKAAAMRIAERVLNELIVENQTQQSSASGTTVDGETNYPWSMRSQTWTEDAMIEMVVTVTFTVQGSEYDVSASTLIAPASSTVEATATSP